MAGIFKAYDIRGVVPDQLDATLARRIGRAMGVWLKNSADDGGEVLVSHDMRSHSPEMTAALITGLRESGQSVLAIGLAATPMNYWANQHFGAKASVSVTASHNAGHYNGFKFSLAQARPVSYDTGIGEMEALVNGWEQNGDPAPEPLGALRTESGTMDQYLDAMDVHLAPLTRPLKIAVDCANGMGGHFMEAFFARHPELTAVPLYWELDGSFPNHEADPLKPENMAPVQKSVVENGCDFGASLDGDADRCMFADEAGGIIPSDLLTAMLAEDVLAEHPGAAILYDLRSSKIVPERIHALGGKPVRGRVGHAFMKQLMREQNARFGGELSGHYYFAECANTDSGLMALISVINKLQKSTTPLSEHVAPLRRYHATGEVNFKVSDVAATLQAIESRYTDDGGTADHLDGLTITFDDWWFNVRPSNTEPLLRLNLEANDAVRRDTQLATISELIRGT